MMVVIGDIHGRMEWNDIVKKHGDDRIVFLGDYVTTHEGISPSQQLYNLADILTFKEDNPERVILLRGNHDNQQMFTWAQCSGFERYVAEHFPKERFLRDSQWVYLSGKKLFSHAGISAKWLQDNNLSVETLNDQEPSEVFGFLPGNPYDVYGDTVTQSCTWIRPEPLTRSAVEGYTQIVGHTPVSKKIFSLKSYNGDDIWLCDALGVGQYLTISNDKFTVNEC